MNLLAITFFLSSLTALTWANPLQQTALDGTEPQETPATQTPALLENTDDDDEEEEEVGNADFEDDDADDAFLDLLDPTDVHVGSLMHVHRRGGEILVGCFGMWWPVGGGYPVYEYVDEYYGDYKKKRRSRKRKRAKAKRKKS